MQSTKLNRLLRSIDHGGFYRSPLSILVTDVGIRHRPRIIAMLYIHDAVHDRSTDALRNLADSAYVSNCDWYPVSESSTISGALVELERRVNRIRGDKQSMDNFFLDLYHCQFHLSKHLEDGSEHLIDIKDLKLIDRPPYLI